MVPGTASMASGDGAGWDRTTVRQTAEAASGGRVVQAGGDLRVTEIHHHVSAPEAVVLVEEVLPRTEGVAEVFVGRDAELGSVLGALDPGREAEGTVVVSAVAGLAGIGKTALARVAAAEGVARGWFPGGAVFVDLNGYALDPERRLGPSQVYGPLLHALDKDAAGAVAPQHQAVRYHRLLNDLAAQGRSCLLVLDNASTSHQVADLLPRSRRHRTVITSRHTLTLRGSRTLALRTLAGDDSAALVRRQLAQVAAWDPRVHEDQGGLRRLCDLCGHLPLALHIVTALLAGAPGLTPAELAGDLARAGSKLDVLDDGERAVRAAFNLSYQRLGSGPARLFRLLPVHPGPHFGMETAVQLLGKPLHEARPDLHELARAHMIEHVGGGAWRQHDLIRDYAIELSRSHGDDQRLPSERLLNHYAAKASAAGEALRTARRAGNPVSHGSQVQDVLAWFDRENLNLRAAVSLGVTFDDVDAALRILEALVRLHRHRGQTAELIETSRRLASVAAGAPGSGNLLWAVAGRAWALGARLEHTADPALACLADFAPEPLFERSVRTRTRVHAKIAELLRAAQRAVSLLEGREQLLAVPLLHVIVRAATGTNLGETVPAEATRTALRLSRSHGDARLETLTHIEEARHQNAGDRRAGALAALDSALEAFLRAAEAGNAAWRGAGRLLATTAMDVARGLPAHEPRPQGLLEDLSTAARLSPRVWRHLGENERLASAMVCFAELHHAAGHYAEAVSLYEDALRELRNTSRGKDLARTLLNVSAARSALGDHLAAADAAGEAAALFDAQEDPAAASRAWTVLSHCLVALDRVEESLTAASAGDRAAVAAGDRSLQASAVLVSALALEKAGRRSQARRRARQVLQITLANGDPALHYSLQARLQDQGLLD
ncbi:ATP-binding protein [Streptomyces sp. NPDC002262]|uniref:ATP-binding protein n=1 Tax=Streptomyces sp. NPDC002262 TaxID=3154414 RepID=UPI00331CAD1F